MANHPGTKLVGVAYKLRKKMKNSPTFVHVLHKTLNVVISHCCFAEDSKEMLVPKCKIHVQSDFCSLNLLFGSVVITIAIVVA